MTSGKASRDSREAKAAERRRAAAKAESRRRNGIITAVVAVVVLVIVGAYVLIQNENSSKTVTSAASPHNTTGKANGTILVGAPSATVLVTLYEDFQCPICKQFEAENAPVLASYLSKDQIKINYRPIAFLDRASTTQYSTRALNSAGCVQSVKPTSFVQYHGLLFTNQPAEGSAGLPNSKLIALAAQAGAGDVSACVNGMTYKDWTVKVTDQSSKDGVNGTPTVIVNNTTLPNPLDPGALKAAIDSALAK